MDPGSAVARAIAPKGGGGALLLIVGTLLVFSLYCVYLMVVQQPAVHGNGSMGAPAAPSEARDGGADAER